MITKDKTPQAGRPKRGGYYDRYNNVSGFQLRQDEVTAFKLELFEGLIKKTEGLRLAISQENAPQERRLLCNEYYRLRARSRSLPSQEPQATDLIPSTKPRAFKTQIQIDNKYYARQRIEPIEANAFGGAS